MNRSIVLAGVAGGTVFFIYSAIAWMVLPWNEGTLKGFPNQQAVVEAMSRIPEAGIYTYPSPDTDMANAAVLNGPSVFAAVRPGPPRPMGPAMAFGFLIDLLAGLLAAWLLSKTTGLSYCRKVCFAAMLGLLSAVFIQASAWNWFGYSAHFTLVSILDTTLSFALAGVVMARLVKTQ